MVDFNRGLEIMELLGNFEYYDEGVDCLRSLCSYGEITNEEYDYVLENWDSLIETFDCFDYAISKLGYEKVNDGLYEKKTKKGMVASIIIKDNVVTINPAVIDEDLAKVLMMLWK